MKIIHPASFAFVAITFALAAFKPVKGVINAPATNTSWVADSLTVKMNHYLAGQVAKGFKGTVLIVKEGTTLINASYGQPNATPDLAYWIASNSKPLLAMAILKLEEQQKINVQDPIRNYFSDIPEDKKHITIHQLLSHSSGLPHKYAMDGIKDFDKALTAVMQLPVDKEKIGKYQYSNDGYNLLVLLLEKVTGTTYETYVTQHLLKPAQLHNSGFWGFEGESKVTIAPPFNPERISKKRAPVYANKSVANYGYRGATGMYSTTNDQYRLYKAMLDGTVLKKENGQKAFQPHVLVRESNGLKTYYGYGWVVSYKEDRLTNIRHSGDEDWLGHNSMRLFYPNGDAIIVLSNAHVTKDEDLWAVQVAYDLQRLLNSNSK